MGPFFSAIFLASQFGSGDFCFVAGQVMICNVLSFQANTFFISFKSTSCFGALYLIFCLYYGLAFLLRTCT
uniref:Uncharacterized protein n=1 Tax=Rhipicephalus microplus TaxID=6941 RepID=A0A6M2DF57_RHIMP